MKKKYIVTLTQEERQSLHTMLSRGKAAARKLMHARVLLKADAAPGEAGWNDAAIAEGLDVGRATVERVRKQFVEEGLEAALERRQSRRQYHRKLDGDAEAVGQWLDGPVCRRRIQGHAAADQTLRRKAA